MAPENTWPHPSTLDSNMNKEFHIFYTRIYNEHQEVVDDNIRLGKENNRLHEANHSYSKAFASLEKDKADLNEENVSLNKAIIRVNKDITHLNTEIGRLNMPNVHLEKDKNIVQLNAEIGSLTMANVRLEKESIRLNGDIVGLNEKNVALSEDVVRRNAQINLTNGVFRVNHDLRVENAALKAEKKYILASLETLVSGTEMKEKLRQPESRAGDLQSLMAEVQIIDSPVVDANQSTRHRTLNQKTVNTITRQLNNARSSSKAIIIDGQTGTKRI